LILWKGGKCLKNFLKKEDMKYVFIGICLILFYWALNNISYIAGIFSNLISLLMPFIVGGVIAFILNVPMRQIEKHLFQGEKFAQKKFASLRRTCAYLLTLILVIAIITMALFVVIPQLVYTIADLVKMIPQQVQNVQGFLIEQFKAYPQLEEQIKSVAIDWDSVIKSSADFLTTGTKGLISGGLGAVTSIISGVTTFFVGFVFSVYVLFQKEKLGSQAKKIIYAFFSEKKADKIIEIAGLSEDTFASFLSGQCLEAVILGSMFCVTMLVIRLPYAVLIGIVIAITALIPIVGAFIGCAVGVILIGLVSPIKAVVFVIMFLVLQQIEGNLIYPHVVGNSVGLPGIWVLFAVTVGGNLFGIAGMLTFIPICSICYALFRTYVNDRLKKKKMDLDS
jgi:predicted PurR-regulated permease PerM